MVVFGMKSSEARPKYMEYTGYRDIFMLHVFFVFFFLATIKVSLHPTSKSGLGKRRYRPWSLPTLQVLLDGALVEARVDWPPRVGQGAQTEDRRVNWGRTGFSRFCTYRG